MIEVATKRIIRALDHHNLKYCTMVSNEVFIFGDTKDFIYGSISLNAKSKLICKFHYFNGVNGYYKQFEYNESEFNEELKKAYAAYIISKNSKVERLLARL